MYAVAAGVVTDKHTYMYIHTHTHTQTTITLEHVQRVNNTSLECFV